jgi:hypothetical protein
VSVVKSNNIPKVRSDDAPDEGKGPRHGFIEDHLLHAMSSTALVARKQPFLAAKQSTKYAFTDF